MKKNVLKLTVATFGIIGAGIILFNAAAEIALAANNGKVEKVPTSYQVSDSLETAVLNLETTKDVGEKVNYSVSMDSLNTGTPTDTDLTMEEAAETGNQYLKNIYGLDLEGAYVYMSYNPGTVTFPRAFWSGVVLFQKEQKPESTKWTYMIDAVTGELFTTCHDRRLDANVSLDYDAALEKDYHLYEELAQTKIEECKLMDCPVDMVEYNCQGYSGNDPTIAVDVIGENGESINMSFSRYDQMFLGLLTDTSRTVTESALERTVGEEKFSEAEEIEAEEIEGYTITWTTRVAE